VNVPRIDRSLTASQLRDRALASMNGESVQLSAADQDRRRRIMDALRAARKGRAG
jgi:hypothetical protein